MITRLTIENFKSIEKLELELGRINVFIGENGAGKSNILEALVFGSWVPTLRHPDEFLLRSNIRIPADKRLFFPAFSGTNLQNPIFSVHLQLAKDDQTRSIVIQSQGDEFMPIVKNDSPEYRSFFNRLKNGEILPAELAAKMNEIHYGPTRQYLGEYLIYSAEYQQLRSFEPATIPGKIGPFGQGLWEHIQYLEEHEPATIDLLKEKLQLISWFEGFSYDPGMFGQRRSLLVKDRYIDPELSKRYDQRCANEGFLFLLFYFTLFASPKTPRFFAVDNIDASFNPKLCRQLMVELADLAKRCNKQALITTHNPAILDGLDLNDEEQRLFVVYRNNNGRTITRRILPPTPIEGVDPVPLSEAFLRGYIGGLPEGF